MDQNLATVLLIVASILFFFIFTAPIYSSIEELQMKAGKLSEVSEKAKDLADRKEEQEVSYNRFVSEYEEALKSIVPLGRDDARSLMTINAIAGANSVRMNDARIVDFARSAENELQSRRGNLPYNAKSMLLDFEATYQDFTRFLTDMERSRRVFDPLSIEFRSSGANVYEFQMRVNTYWIEEQES